MKFIVILTLSTAIGLGIAWGGGQGGVRAGDFPVFVVVAALAFVINWLAFIPAFLGKTEKYYDLVGSLTYLSVIGVAVYLSKPLSVTGAVVAGLVGLWAVRLGSFLFLRIHRAGGDDRFDLIKTNPLRFLVTWTLQALWVVLTAACALAIITTPNQGQFGAFFCTGLVLWLIGFGIEVIADAQKSAFRKNPDNKDMFITTGLWSWSRHANYFGEITLWTGIAVMAVPVLTGWQWVVMISPVFVYLLLTRVSGIPLLERKAKKKWGGDPEYQSYLQRTSRLIPLPPKK